MSQDWRGKAVRDLLGALYGVVEVLRAPYHSAAWERALQQVEAELERVRAQVFEGADPETESSWPCSWRSSEDRHCLAPIKRGTVHCTAHQGRHCVVCRGYAWSDCSLDSPCSAYLCMKVACWDAHLQAQHRSEKESLLDRARKRREEAGSAEAPERRLICKPRAWVVNYLYCVEGSTPSAVLKRLLSVYEYEPGASLTEAVERIALNLAFVDWDRPEQEAPPDPRQPIPKAAYERMKHWERKNEDSPFFVPVHLLDHEVKSWHDREECTRQGGRCAFRSVEGL